jgi:hypothetical protein
MTAEGIAKLLGSAVVAAIAATDLPALFPVIFVAGVVALVGPIAVAVGVPVYWAAALALHQSNPPPDWAVDRESMDTVGYSYFPPRYAEWVVAGAGAGLALWAVARAVARRRPRGSKQEAEATDPAP